MSTPDHTDHNRSTYDRIAARYDADLLSRWTPEVGGFAELRSELLERLPHDAVIGDLGCGPGHDGRLLADGGHRVVGIDLSTGMLELAAPRLEGRVLQADLRRLPLAEGSLDGIWNAASLLHVPDADTTRVLSAFRRVLVSGGWLAMATAVAGTSGFEAVAYAPGEERWFVYRDVDVLRSMLVHAGFELHLEQLRSSSRTWWSVLAREI